MCQLITPCYPCGHKDDGWMLYCNPTRKICGRKHPPLEVCSSKNVAKINWNTFEPRCTKCEKKHRAGLEKEAKRRKSGRAGSSIAKRRASLIDGFRELFRVDSAMSTVSRQERGSNSSSNGSERTNGVDADSLDMLEMKNTLTSLEGVELGAIDVEPRPPGTSFRGSHASSIESMPCSPRTSIARADDYFS